MQRRTFVLGTMVLSFAVSPTWAADVFSGNWKTNLAKSKYDPADLAPKSGQGKIEAIEDGLKFTNDAVDASGKAIHNEWSGKFDGKDNPVTGDPNRDTAALTKIDDYTFEIISKKGGKVVSTNRETISRDGKTNTQTPHGTSAQGVKFSHTIVSEKQ